MRVVAFVGCALLNSVPVVAFCAELPSVGSEMNVADICTEFDGAMINPHTAPPYGAYGKVLINADFDKDQPNRATCFFNNPNGPGKYMLKVKYASADERPTVILVNGIKLTDNGMAIKTNGWAFQDQRWLDQGTIGLQPGKNRITFDRQGPFPHIAAITFEPTE